LYSAEFDTIPRLEKGHPIDAVMDLRVKPSGTCFKEFEALLKYELETASKTYDFTIRVPLVVRFYDATKEIVYQTTHEVIYDAFWHEAHIHLVQGTVPIQLPYQHGAGPTEKTDGGAERMVKYIMRGTQQQLLAYETTREGFPGMRYLVRRIAPNQDPKSCHTPNATKQTPNGTSGSRSGKSNRVALAVRSAPVWMGALLGSWGSDPQIPRAS
jgi:hypothetical protein